MNKEISHIIAKYDIELNHLNRPSLIKNYKELIDELKLYCINKYAGKSIISGSDIYIPAQPDYRTNKRRDNE